MPDVKIVRRWGSNQPGEVVELSETEANWLVGIGFGEDPRHEGHSTANSKAPGTDGPDPRAGGDPTRRRMTSARSARVEQNLSGRVQGAPATVGDVTHVKPENLAESHRDNPGDVRLASGKRLSEELEEQQRELEEQEKKRQAEESKAQEPKRDLGGSRGKKSESARTASGESPPAAGQQQPATPEGRRLSQPNKG